MCENEEQAKGEGDESRANPRIELWESMRLFRKSIGYATVGAGVAGVTIYLAYGPEELKRRITSNGLVRVARAARTVSR